MNMTLTCIVCGRQSEAYDKERNPHAWDGWTISPNEKCPEHNGYAAYEEEKKVKVLA